MKYYSYIIYVSQQLDMPAVVNDGVKRMKKGLEYSARKQIINQ